MDVLISMTARRREWPRHTEMDLLSDAPGPMESVFARIHRDNLWGDAESGSGPGSMVHLTRLVRPALEALLRGLHVTTLLDPLSGDGAPGARPLLS